MRHITIKEKTTEVKGTDKYSKKSLSTHFLSRIFLPYWLKHRRRFGWCHIGVLLFLPVHFAGFSPTETTSFTASSIRYDKEFNCWFFASLVWHCLWECLSFKPSFPVTKEFLEVQYGSRGHTSPSCCATTTNPSLLGQCRRANSLERRTAKDNGILKCRTSAHGWKPKWRRIKLSS